MRNFDERFFDTSDGTRLFYRHWAPVHAETAPDRAIVLLHRGHEHSGRLAHVVDEIDLPGFAFFAWDARGHGHSGNSAKTIVTLATFVRDLDEFVRHVSSAHDIAVENIAIIAQSVGSVLAATWAHDYAPRIRCMVLASPAFKVKLYVPFARPALGFMNKFFKNMRVNSYVKARALTHDPERIASFESDPLIQRPISVRVLVGLYSTADRVIADAQAIHTPTQLLMSGKDWVVHHKPQHQFFEGFNHVAAMSRGDVDDAHRAAAFAELSHGLGQQGFQVLLPHADSAPPDRVDVERVDQLAEGSDSRRPVPVHIVQGAPGIEPCLQAEPDSVRQSSAGFHADA